MGAKAAWFRRAQEVSADSEHSRRATRCLRPHFRSRISVDGCEGLRGALPESARQHELRPGIRQRDPISLSRRRFKDLMAGVDELIKRGYIDDKKLGVTGGSGGGLLTNWVVGQTGRFAAAVSQRDIASWENWWYTGDFTLFQPNWFRAPPFEDPDEY